MVYFIAALLGVLLDQGVKLWVVKTLELHASAPLLPGLVELMHIHNTGAGFSLLTGHTWLLALITVLLMALIGLVLVKRVFSHPLALWSLTAILSGGIGNLIDRVRLGYVVDMFHFQFWPSYPVFNVADILVVLGVIGFAVYYLFLHDKAEKKEADSHGSDHDAAGAP